MVEPGADELLPVGRITGAYGIRGWVKIQPYTESAATFLAFGHWQLQRRGGCQPVVFDQGRVHGRGLVVHIEGVDAREVAETYSGLEVLVPRSELPQLQSGDYYWSQLEGLQVWCSEGGQRALLGVVDHLIETGAHDVLVIRPCEGSLDDRERLIPYRPGTTVVGVDLDRRLMEVDWFLREE